MMNAKPIIQLDDNCISYKPGRHGSYYDPKHEWQDCDYELDHESGKYIKVNVKDMLGRYFSCDVFSDETFIRLWFSCSTIQQFCASYAVNHEYDYSPSEQSCRLRARNIENRLEMDLPILKSGTVNTAERKLSGLRHLVGELRLQQEAEELGIIPPMLH